IRVDQFGLVLEHPVDLDDLARDRRIELRHRLDRLDRAERLPGLQPLPDLRQSHGDDIAELLLSVVGYADLAAIAGKLDPLMVFGVLERRRISHRTSQNRSTASTTAVRRSFTKADHPLRTKRKNQVYF